MALSHRFVPILPPMDRPRLEGPLAGAAVILLIVTLAAVAQLFGDVAALGLLVALFTFAAAAAGAPRWMVSIGPGLAFIVAALSLAEPHVLLGEVLAIFGATVLAGIGGLGIAAWRRSREGSAGKRTQPRSS